MLKINKWTILKTIFNVLIFSKIFFWLCSSADLKITEVFPYGKNERIEIYNNDKIAFSWDIEITWVKSQPLKLKNISINPWKTIIVWDSWIVKINDSQVLDKKWLSISDESAIDISIILDWVVLDNFKVLKQDIVSTDKKNSFEKVFLGLDIVVKSVNKYSSNNILPSIQANPGIVHILGHDENSPILQSNNIPQSNTKIDKSKIVKQTKTKSNLSTSSTKEDKLAEQNRILKEEIEQVREELSLTKTCLSLLSSKLKQNRNSIYYKDW